MKKWYSCWKGPAKIPLGKGSAGKYEAVSCVNTCTICEIGLFTEEEDVEQIGVLAISCMSL